jgi:hypothetical protein
MRTTEDLKSAMEYIGASVLCDALHSRPQTPIGMKSPMTLGGQSARSSRQSSGPARSGRRLRHWGCNPLGGAAPRPTGVREDDADEGRCRCGGRRLPLARAREHLHDIAHWQQRGWAQVGGAVHARVYAKMSAEEKETIVQRKMAEIDEVGAGNGETPPPSPTPL